MVTRMGAITVATEKTFLLHLMKLANEFPRMQEKKKIRGVPTSSSEDTNEIGIKIGSIVDVCIEIKMSRYPTELKATERFLP